MNDPTNTAVDESVRVILLRHGEVRSHRGDVSVTEEGLLHAERAGKVLAARIAGPFTVLFGGTRRTRETAQALVRGIGDGLRAGDAIDSFALRNPDAYIAGTRVNMVSSHEALAEQVPGMTVREAEESQWWSTFITSSDRIGWWLNHPDPPGETGADVASRLLRFARSIADSGPMRTTTVVGVTHSPLLRSLLRYATGADAGEPRYVGGVLLRIRASGEADISAYDPMANQT